MTPYLLALASFLGLALLWAWGFYIGFRVGRRTMMRDLGPYLPIEPGETKHPFRDPLE